MKKLLLIILTIIFSACSKQPSEQRFVNPLFYETLEPISRMSWQTQLSPTKIVSTNDGYSEANNCIMINNTQEVVVLECEESSTPKLIYIYTYTIQPYDEFYKGILIQEEISRPNKKWFSRSTFVIRDKK